MARHALRIAAATMIVGALYCSARGIRAEPASEKASIEAANHEFDQALSTRDIDAMEKVWAKEPYVIAIHPSSKTPIVGWTAVKASWQATFDRFAEISVSMKEPQIRINQNVAWIVGVETVSGKLKNGDAAVFAALTTNVFEKLGGRWSMVLHSTSRLPQ